MKNTILRAASLLRTALSALLLCVLAAPSLAAPPAGVTVQLSAPRSSISASEDLSVTVTIHNGSRAPLRVLRWHTPTGEIEESLFEITRDGQPVEYLGAHYKRQAPTATDFVVVAPGKSLVATVELTALYDMSVSGQYSIRFDTRSPNLFNERATAVRNGDMDSLSSNAIGVYVSGGSSTSSAAKATSDLLQPAAATLSFSGRCSNTQQTDLRNAHNAAVNYAGGALAYLQSKTSSTVGQRYTKWFGTPDSLRFTTVSNNFGKINTAFNNAAITYDCSCKKTYYAYVYSNQPYKIYVCKAFWTAPMTGTDSKAGTLIHEMSHFSIVAGTDDWVYGQAGAASLATSDPAKAVDNADSHEYFAENTPALQ